MISRLKACHYQAIFGEGDDENRNLRSVSRFGEVTIDPEGSCQTWVIRSRKKNFTLSFEATATLHYGDQTYRHAGERFHLLATGDERILLRTAPNGLSSVIVMGFKIPSKISLRAASAEPKIVNMDDLKEETVDGHPTSVLYKLLAGPRSGKRDAIDDAYVVTSLFWMDFAPGGTNFPHHHETAEEIYLVIDGEGDMVAGGGMDGIEGRHPAKAGDAYYFRPTARWVSTTRTSRERRLTFWRCDRGSHCPKKTIRYAVSSTRGPVEMRW